MAADPGQLVQVLINLATNAIEAMPEGGGLVMGSHPVEGGVELVISDSGVGIPPEMMNSIFDPLVTRKAGGTGLGLALVKAIVDAHGGRIRVESTREQGSTFTVFLPAP